MKILLLLIVVLFWLNPLQAQQVSDTSLQFSKTDYLLKSKRAKTTGFLLVGLGTVTLFTGGLISINGATEEAAASLTCVLSLGFTCPEVEEAKRRQRTGNAIAITGLGTALASIPFFISASKNKKTAKAMSIRLMEPVPVDAIIFKESHPFSVKLVVTIK